MQHLQIYYDTRLQDLNCAVTCITQYEATMNIFITSVNLLYWTCVRGGPLC